MIGEVFWVVLEGTLQVGAKMLWSIFNHLVLHNLVQHRTSLDETTYKCS